MAVIGVHEVLLVPSFKGGQSAIGRELDKTMSKASRDTGKRSGNIMSTAIGTALGYGGAKVAGAAMGSLTSAFTKGFGRLTAIENARAKLSGLGHEAGAVESIMTDALASVKGTAFGLDEAASVAASAVAAGVKPGKDLQRTLKLTGDAATIAGVEMGEMGSIVNKVATSDMMQMDVANQLMDAGIPIIQMVAQEMGVTAEEARKMASDGEVSFATFQAALEDGLGGAALKSGETLQGAMKNAGAALGRFGANLMSGVYPHVKNFFNGFMAFMEPMEAGAKVMGDAVGAAIGRMADGLTGLWDLLVNRDYTGKFREAFGWDEDSAIVDMLLKLRDGVAWFANEGIPKIGDFGKAMWDAREGIGIAATAITVTLIPAMMLSATEAAKSAAAHVIAWTTKRKEAIKTAWQYQKTAYAMVGHMLLTAGVAGFIATAHVLMWSQMSGAAVKHSLRIAGAWLIALGPVFWIGAAIAAALAGIVALVVMNWDHIVNFTRTAWEAVAGFVAPAWEAVVDAVKTGIDWVVNLAQGAWQGAVDLFGAVWQGVSDFLRIVWETSIKPLFDGIVAAWQFVADIFNAVWQSTLKPVFDGIGAVVGWLWQHIIQPFFYNMSQVALLAFDLIVYAWNNFLKPMFAALGTFLLDLWNNVISGVFKWIGDSWNVMVEGVKFVWESILKPVFQAVGDFIKWVWDNAISPVLSWIGDKWDWLVRFWKFAWETYLQPVLEAFGKWVYDTWKNYVDPVLRWIGDAWGGMVNGIRDLWNGVLRPVFKAVGDFVSSVWTTYIQPVFRWIGDAWGGMVNGIKDLWNNTLKPVLKAFGDFVYVTVVQRIRDGVAMITNAWAGISKGFANTINWVLTHVWNRGIVEAFNNVAEAVDSEARLKPAGLIATGDAGGSKAAVGRAAHRGAQARARGGEVKAGQPYWVGEFGPELIWPDRDGYVSTAMQSASLLARGKDLDPELSRKAAGRNPREAVAPMGDGFNWGAAGSYLKDQLGLGKLLGTDQLVAGVGQLAEYAKGILDPLVAKIAGGSPFGLLAKDWAGEMADKVISWAKGKDSAAMAGGAFGGDYTGDPSGFNRPMGGPITSRFGPRWGSMHSGIDIAAPIGTAVRAAFNGVVQKAAWNALTGRTGMGMVLGHGGGRQTYYGHLSQWLARPGQNVRAGQTIARSGNTGRSTGPHLHFEELRGGRAVNPGYLFRDQGGNLPPGLNMVLNNRGRDETILPMTPREAEAAFLRQGAGGGLHIHGDMIGFDERELVNRWETKRAQAMLAAGVY